MICLKNCIKEFLKVLRLNLKNDTNFFLFKSCLEKIRLAKNMNIFVIGHIF